MAGRMWTGAAGRAAAIALAGAAAPAQALEDCGPPVMGAVLCTLPVMGQSFVDADGILYDSGVGGGLDVTLSAAVIAEHARLSGSNAAADQSLTNHGTIQLTAVASMTAQAGLFASVPVGGMGSVTLFNDGTITTVGDSDDGIRGAVGDGRLSIMHGGSIVTHGAGTAGIAAFSEAGAIDIDVGGSISTTTGSAGFGLFVRTASGAVHVTSTGTIDTVGSGDGVNIRGSGLAPVTFDLLAGHIATTGNLADGVDIATLGTATLTIDGAVSVQGISSRAIVVSAAGGIDMTLSGTVASTFGNDSSRALELNSAGGALNLTINAGGSATSDNNGFALSLNGATVTVDNAGTVGSQDHAVFAAGAVTFRNSGILRGGVIFLAADDLLENRAGALFDLAPLDLGAEIDGGGGMDLLDNQAGATLSLRSGAAGGDLFEVANLERFHNAGRITMADLETGGLAPDPGDVLSIDGAFESAGGSLALDVTLGGDGSAADLLRVGSTTLAGGPTLIEVVNAGGLGATTQQGIRVVEVLGASAEGAFALAAPVSVGGIDYNLVLGEDGDWYLVGTRSALLAPPRDFAGAALLTLWQQGLGTLHQRLGELRPGLPAPRDQRASFGAADLAEGAGANPGDLGLWLRVTGSRFDFDSSVGQPFRQSGTFLQAGIDGELDDASEQQLLLAGLAVSLGESTADSAGDSLSLSSYGVALYGTWLSGPWYADGVLKADYAWIARDTAGHDEGAGGWVYGLSLEGGYRAQLGEALNLEPQAQLALSHGLLGTLDDTLGRPIEFDRLTSLRGRFGIVAGSSFELPGSIVLAPRLTADLLHEFLGDTRGSSGDLHGGIDLGGTAVQLGGGLTVQDRSGGFGLHVEGAWQDGDSGQGFNVTAGLRIAL